MKYPMPKKVNRISNLTFHHQGNRIRTIGLPPIGMAKLPVEVALELSVPEAHGLGVTAASLVVSANSSIGIGKALYYKGWLCCVETVSK